MANVVLCSEFGRGSPYLAKLADYAVELQAQGHSVRLVCRDIKTAHYLPEFDQVSIFPAPRVELDANRRVRQSGERPLNYSSVLLQKGYREARTLTPLLRSWLHYMATLDADLVVADHSPTALLAAKLLHIPCVMTGTGYTVPPKIHPLPCLAPWKTAKKGEAQTNIDLIFEDEKLLQSLNLAIHELGFNDLELKRAHEIFSHAAQWLITLPEMDHYGRRKAPYLVRWISRRNQPMPVWPSGSGDKIFVYMHADAPHLGALLAQLKELGRPVLAVVPKVSDAFKEQYQTANIKIQAQPVNIPAVVEQCKSIVNHGGHDLVYELLSIGVPSIFLASNPENTLLAYCLSKNKLGFAGPADPRRLDILTLLDLSNRHEQVWHNAAKLATKYQNRTSLERLHDMVTAKLNPTHY